MLLNFSWSIHFPSLKVATRAPLRRLLPMSNTICVAASQNRCRRLGNIDLLSLSEKLGSVIKYILGGRPRVRPFGCSSHPSSLIPQAYLTIFHPSIGFNVAQLGPPSLPVPGIVACKTRFDVSTTESIISHVIPSKGIFMRLCQALSS